MNRKELLRLLVNQAQFNGFEFRRWFQANIQPAWPGTEQALLSLPLRGVTMPWFSLMISCAASGEQVHASVSSFLQSHIPASTAGAK